MSSLATLAKMLGVAPRLAEDAIDDLDLEELQKLLNEWCAKQKTCSWFATGVALDPAEVDSLCREASERDANEEQVDG